MLLRLCFARLLVANLSKLFVCAGRCPDSTGEQWCDREVQMYSWSLRMGPIRHNSNSLVVQFTVPEYQEAGCCRGMASDTQLPPARHLSGAAENWGIHARRISALRLGPLQCSTVSIVMMAVPAATSNANSSCCCCCCCPSSCAPAAPPAAGAVSRRQLAACKWLPGFSVKQPFPALMSSSATHTAAIGAWT
jgi:hypothetical protein